MQRNEKKILEYLYQENEHEQFYHQRYDALQDPEQFADFYDQWKDRGAELYKKRLIFPEVEGSWYPVDMRDEQMGSIRLEDNETITLCKHNRYTPVFKHRHTFFEILYVFEGKCTNEIDGQKVVLHTGELCLIAPFTEHSIGVFDDSIVINILISRTAFSNMFHSLLCHSNILSDFFSGSLYLYQQNAYLYASTQADFSFRELLLDMLDQQLCAREYRNLVKNSQLVLFFSLLLQNYEDQIRLPHAQKLENRAVEIIKYIEQNYRSITLNELADHFGYSTAYLSRYLKKATQKSFTAIVQEIKFDQVCTQLETSDRSVAEIASSAGFESIEHFTRLFKKRMNQSPSQYRKAHRE
ncbi:AraC family transcriptional regulator [Allobaculum sp. JKK-2023]|uniref:AraC family transcriptional regulator n=1 Tax=Allobaculum sp. JKK-2023 TaxID=3108943 RepID=UPI002B05FD9A|nr:AraC family transcriptional regulator [Allobaculum sp. JKK-2023]